jgi:hypothetical protein
VAEKGMGPREDLPLLTRMNQWFAWVITLSHLVEAFLPVVYKSWGMASMALPRKCVFLSLLFFGITGVSTQGLTLAWQVLCLLLDIPPALRFFFF